MPRERVHHGKIFVVGPEDPNSGNPPTVDGRTSREWHPSETISPEQVLREEPSLDVHWNRDGEYVQIGFEAPTHWWKKFLFSQPDDHEAISATAFTDRLTRKEINNMIKTLRRARDAAYGTDE